MTREDDGKEGGEESRGRCASLIEGTVPSVRLVLVAMAHIGPFVCASELEKVDTTTGKVEKKIARRLFSRGIFIGRSAILVARVGVEGSSAEGIAIGGRPGNASLAPSNGTRQRECLVLSVAYTNRGGGDLKRVRVGF